MANSRKPLPDADPLLAVLSSQSPGDALQRIAVAFSGGRDSTVLLDVLSRWCSQRDIALIALHVHHGLQAAADDWLNHCRDFCQVRDIAFFFRRVHITEQAYRQHGLEGAARQARYHALRTMAVEQHASVVALAHHANDQAETVVFNLARGAGSAGVAGMPVWHENPAGLGWWRPLLDVPAAHIAQYATQHELPYVQDPTNDDPQYARNCIRHQVLPALQQAVPGALAGLARAARHAQSTRLLEQQAGDFVLSQVQRNGALEIARLSLLPPALRQATLRAWCTRQGWSMPSEAQLHELWRQASTARADAQVQIMLQGHCIRRYRGWLSVDTHDPLSDAVEAQTYQWDGQSHWQPTGWPGFFIFQAVHDDTPGVPESLLRSALLSARVRSGAERLRLHQYGASRPLKQWYQALGIPPWQRRRTPLLYVGEHLLFVPGVGQAVDKEGIVSTSAGARHHVSWVAHLADYQDAMSGQSLK